MTGAPPLRGLSDRSRARRAERDRRDGTELTRSHETGICGDLGSLCGECHADERADLAAWARNRPAPLSEETPGAYWRRIGGPFLDAWYGVAVACVRAAQGGADGSFPPPRAPP